MSVNADKSAARVIVDHEQLEAFQRAISDHAFTSEYVVAASHGHMLFDEQHPDRRRREMRRFLSEHVIKHFDFEEKEVFPALRRGNAPAIVRIIDELVAEHETMLVQARALQKSLAELNPTGNPEQWARVEQGFRDLLKTVLDHSVKEDNLFLSHKRHIH